MATISKKERQTMKRIPALLFLNFALYLSASPKGYHASRCNICIRNAEGKIARSSKAKHSFEHSHPCPSTGKTSGACPGFIVDHVVPLKRGGLDKPENMQWQTVEDAKAKDKVE